MIAITPPAKLREALEPLATPEVRQRVQLDLSYLLEHPDAIVPYFTKKDADEALLLVGGLLKGQKFDPTNLSPTQQQTILKALETDKADNWLARKYRKTKKDWEQVGRSNWQQQLPLSSEAMRILTCQHIAGSQPAHTCGRANA